jgi:hypothetical protein
MEDTDESDFEHDSTEVIITSEDDWNRFMITSIPCGRLIFRNCDFCVNSLPPKITSLDITNSPNLVFKLKANLKSLKIEGYQCDLRMFIVRDYLIYNGFENDHILFKEYLVNLACDHCMIYNATVGSTGVYKCNRISFINCKFSKKIPKLNTSTIIIRDSTEFLTFTELPKSLCTIHTFGNFIPFQKAELEKIVTHAFQQRYQQRDMIDEDDNEKRSVQLVHNEIWQPLDKLMTNEKELIINKLFLIKKMKTLDELKPFIRDNLLGSSITKFGSGRIRKTKKQKQKQKNKIKNKNKKTKYK